MPTTYGKGRNYQQQNKLTSQKKSDFGKPNLVAEQEILNYVFSSRQDLNGLGQPTSDSNSRMYQPSVPHRSFVQKSEGSQSYSQQQSQELNTYDKMPSLVNEKHKLILNNAKNVSRNNIRDLTNSNTLSAPKNDMSFIQKDTSPSNLKLHMLSFERQPLNMLIDKSLGKLVSQDNKN